MAYSQITEEVQLKRIDDSFVDISLSDDGSQLIDYFSLDDVTQAAIDTLQNSIKGTELENDRETQLLIQLIAGSINYSSKSVVNRIKRLREILLIGKEIIQEIKKDREEYVKMDCTFRSLIEILFNLIKKCKNDLCSKLTTLELAKGELNVIIDVLYPETRTMSTSAQPLKLLSTEDRHDMLLSVSTLKETFQDIIGEATTHIKECQVLKENVNSFQYQQVQPVQQRVSKRLRFWKTHIRHIAGGGVAGAAVGGGVGGGLIGLPIAGAVGAVVIAGVSFPPVAVAMVCLVGGAVAVGGLTIAILRWMKNSYLKEQKKIFDWLNKLLEQVNELSLDTETLERSIVKSKQGLVDVGNSLSALMNALSSERHREAHSKLCQQAVKNCQEVIDSIKELELMDFDYEWNEEKRLCFRQGHALPLE
ncbi:unnamed protein product [Rotaria socialis]|uniref:Uncharacterized protein n=1 Tax=Rotaria socialis TaxID=392032 RepID=A0A818DPX6_9BILA|nr:unnamed protein product [Rotaria socialis]CAF4870157.1 unnamed protein product [Rotaria socialis]